MANLWSVKYFSSLRQIFVNSPRWPAFDFFKATILSETDELSATTFNSLYFQCQYHALLLAGFLPSQVYNISMQMLQIQMYLQTAYISVRNSWSNLVFSQNLEEMWVTSTIRSHSAQITSPRVVKQILFNPPFCLQLLHEQIQIHRQNSILEKTCSCNRIKLKYQATKKKIKSTWKHRRLGSKFCDRLHHNYVTCSKARKIH